MHTKATMIKNHTGLHARPAYDFVQAAKQFSSSITIKKVGEEKAVNAKSIVLLLSMGLAQGTFVEISAEGDDEEAAVNFLIALIEEGFGEL